VSITDYAIGNGLVVTTSFGAGGYFSYPDRMLPAKKESIVGTDFNDDRVGICHIIPTYLVRKKGRKVYETNDFRYVVDADSEIQVRLLRDAQACLYGTTLHSRGVPVRLGETVKVVPSRRVAKVIEFI
jgi:NAD+ kinase